MFNFTRRTRSTKKPRRWKHLLPAAALLALIASAVPALAEASAAERTEFNKLISQRNDLARKLVQADRQAAEKIKRGESADIDHARQIAIQDQLDTVSMRIESASIRHGLPIPPMPDPGAPPQTVNDQLDQQTRARLERGQRRALTIIRQETLQMLASIDYESFLADKPPVMAD